MSFRIIGIFFFFCLLFSCKQKQEFTAQEIRQQKKNDDPVLKRILEAKKLVAATEYNSTSYFLFRGEPMGYQYEILKSFADFLDVKLEINIFNGIDSSINCLNSRECDINALGLAVTKDYLNQVEFCIPLTHTRQMLVQCKPDGWRKMATAHQVNAYLIRNPLYLSGKTIHIQKNSVFKNRLQHLSDEIGGEINIIEHSGATVEELIGMVARREIEYTVSEEYIAMVNQKYYPDIDVSTPISFPQSIAWAVRKEAYGLLDTINYWLNGYKLKRESVLVFNKYFKNTGRRISARGGVLLIAEGKISPFDEIIRQYSQKIKWDWRLLASLIYQESRFYSDTIASSGAFGLMQMMPNTATKYDIDSLSTPESQISAGVDYIALLDNQFAEKGVDTVERVKFVLAAYNAGIAHVFDAQRLAAKYKKNPLVWEDNVDFYLLNKSRPQFYNDTVVKYGYCRGDEAYNFVIDVMDRFEHYKNMIKE
jgi:membrane-bound lytic murein transglycosylase F